jgi:diaminohydroxyphosphoribosylaminopyrimidine deaminase / 5-amino-6-(5-phosphoribosylamino)uracil reductase
VSSPIDEQTAWNLIRAVPALAGRGSALVRHDSRPDAWLQVNASGEWQASSGLTDEARDVVELYLPIQLRPDLVIAQLGQSLDGRIATESGHSHYITGDADIRRLHRVRALVDAVIIGAGTVAADNPRLTVRLVEGENPVRVVLDPDARLAADRHVFSDGAARTLVVRRAPDGDAASSLLSDILTVPVNGEGKFEPVNVLEALRNEGYRRVLVEGGGITVSRFLRAGAVDRLHVTVAPLLIGSGRPALTLEPIHRLDEALRPRCRHFHLGEDILFDLDLR